MQAVIDPLLAPDSVLEQVPPAPEDGRRDRLGAPLAAFVASRHISPMTRFPRSSSRGASDHFISDDFCVGWSCALNRMFRQLRRFAGDLPHPASIPLAHGGEVMW